jgi:hypothetical protein
VAEGGFALSAPRTALLALLLLAFFSAFNVLEALLPSLVSRPKETSGASSANTSPDIRPVTATSRGSDDRSAMA